MLARLARCAALCAFAIAVLSGCGGGGEAGGEEPRPTPTRSAELPSPTRSVEQPSPTRTVEQPSPTRTVEQPSPTRTTAPPESTEPPPPSRTQETETTSKPAEPTRQPEETSGPSEADETQVQGSEESTETVQESSEESDQTPAWVWWLLAAIILAALAGLAALLVHNRRKHQWQAELRALEGELGWFARVLLPDLRRSPSLEQLVGGWKVGAPRVVATEDRLTVLEASAPSDADRSRARTLRDAARLAHQRMDELAVAGPHETWALDLDEVVADLEVALGPTTSATSHPD